MALSDETIALLGKTIALSDETIALLGKTIALSDETIVLSAYSVDIAFPDLVRYTRRGTALPIGINLT
ncbi:hypothetical protein [Nostoc sp.]